MHSACWPGSLKALAKELGTYRSEFLAVQVRWDKTDTERAKENTYFYILVGKHVINWEQD